MKKLLLVTLLCTQAAWACGVGYGPELAYLVIGVIVVAGIPMLAAPLLGMLLARKRDHRYKLGAAWGVPLGWGASLAASIFLGLPGYFVGLVLSVVLSMAVAVRFQVAKDSDPSGVGLNPTA